jgi:hypothetical protein
MSHFKELVAALTIYDSALRRAMTALATRAGEC